MALNSKITYKANIMRLLGFWVCPALMILIPFLIISIAPIKPKADIAVFFVLILFFVIVSICLFANHYKHAVSMQLIIGGKELTVVTSDGTRTHQFSDLGTIREFSPVGRAYWSNIFFWTIELSGELLVISNLTISRADFERYFYNRIDHVKKTFPILSI